MRAVACLCALLLPGVVACEPTSTPSPEPSTRAAAQAAATSSGASAPTGGASARPPSAQSQAASALAPASAAASASAPTPAASPCPADAKRYDEPKFCVVLPEKTLEMGYEGGPEEGSAQLEVGGGGVLRFSWVPLARLGKESIKAQLERVNKGEELAGSGDIPGGAWSDVKKVDGDQKGKHVVQSAVTTPKLVVNCHYTVDEAQAAQARAVCESVRAY